MVVKELMADPVVVDPMIGLVLHIPPVQQDRELEVAEVIEQVTVQAAEVVLLEVSLRVWLREPPSVGQLGRAPRRIGL